MSDDAAEHEQTALANDDEGREDDGPECTIEETIAELDGYERGERIDPILIADSAAHWLEVSDVQLDDAARERIAAGETRATVAAELRDWLGNEDPWLADDVIDSALFWLRRATPRKETF